jgi:mRNA-degrading endonuclease toxin of MazEF toxin-antitoxin module
MTGPRRKADCVPEEWARELNAIRRGRVLKVDLRGAVGRELRGPHYCVVVSKDVLNTFGTIMVVPLVSHGGRGVARQYEVQLKAGDGDLGQPGAAVPHQIRTIERSERVTEIWGTLSDVAMEEIDDHLGWALDLFDDDEISEEEDSDDR